ncbi:low molecular weight phosphotyrosine protein phosphatase [Amylibacter sp. SFDW26]|uniref:low molecular weight protein-tyrosine-phosphatase n=1 Tax=Amylibacter sp. SFDW26 TaxID=2652722 RepID=UPI0012616DAC|nr:low molecular weight protein-tyrosine-phosphatase [Amylibacter sp. SFDW26]KAB7616166.1 low molecular weight phosphotyrosine protein phosphatase [Amylibacter sp. SFDW26]
MPSKIMFVCLGNICRSPTAEGVFRGLAAQAGLDVIVDSSGTGGWHVGEQPDRRAMAEAASRGYDLSEQRSRQVCQEDFNQFDLILAMDKSNLNNLKSIAPCGSQAELKLFLEYAPNQPLTEVPDPYYEDNFEGVFDLIEEASRGLIKALS